LTAELNTKSLTPGEVDALLLGNPPKHGLLLALLAFDFYTLAYTFCRAVDVKAGC
jgi:hypothetical protein